MLNVNREKFNEWIAKDGTSWFRDTDIPERTKKHYVKVAKYFIRWLEKNDIDSQSYLKFKRHLERQNLQVTTKNKYLTIARFFIRQLVKKGIISMDISVNIKSFRNEVVHKKFGLTNEEVNQVARYIKKLPRTSARIRLNALFSILLYQGFRGIEVNRLDLKDINFEEETILVRGKGRDAVRPAIMHMEVVKALKEYINDSKITSGPLFISFQPKNRRGRLSMRGIYHIMTNLHQRLGIKKGVHAYRHYFVTYMLQVFGNNPVKVQQFSRHKNLSMLQIYNDEVNSLEDKKKYLNSFKNIDYGA